MLYSSSRYNCCLYMYADKILYKLNDLPTYPLTTGGVSTCYIYSNPMHPFTEPLAHPFISVCMSEVLLCCFQARLYNSITCSLSHAQALLLSIHPPICVCLQFKQFIQQESGNTLWHGFNKVSYVCK